MFIFSLLKHDAADLDTQVAGQLFIKGCIMY